MCNHDTCQSNSAKPEIIHNRGRCKLCGDIIESTYRHAFVTCRCGACSVDGGHDYLRRCLASPDCFEELSVIKPCGDSCENASDSNPIPTRSLTLPQNGFLRNTAMLLRNLRKDRTINCHSRRHILRNITLVIFSSQSLDKLSLW